MITYKTATKIVSLTACNPMNNTGDSIEKQMQQYSPTDPGEGVFYYSLVTLVKTASKLYQTFHSFFNLVYSLSLPQHYFMPNITRKSNEATCCKYI